MESKVSFVVTVYKVESFLDKCVQSLVSQSYNNFEILLVDDGSPDGCPQLCESWAARDCRIKVFHKVNGGSSDARNYGLERASGDYLIFVDGDDFWRSGDDLRELVRIAESNQSVDFVGFNCCYYYSKGERYIPWVKYDGRLGVPSGKNETVVALVKSGTFPMSACSKMFKRNFLLSNSLFFVNEECAEDIPWFINVLDKCDKCIFVNKYIYAYRQNVSGSITHSPNRKKFRCLFDIFKRELSEIGSRSFCASAKEAVASFLAYEYCILLTYPGLSSAERNELYQYGHVLRNTVNPKVAMASWVYKLFGIRATEYVLRMYQRMRKSKR